MRFFRVIRYFSRLRALLGFRAACAFSWAHIWNKINPPRDGKLASVPVGAYMFYFPSLAYFEGLFTEIFFKETYYLASTQKAIQVIDCGANIGVSLLYIKIRAPHARVLCFEPNPAARAVLEKNIAANGWGKEVRVFPYALGKTKGSTEFFVEGQEATSSGGGVARHIKKKGQILNAYTVDVDVLSAYITSAIDFLKIDIEGGEFDVLEELIMHNKLQHVAQLQLEYHYIPGFFTRPLQEMTSLLETQGFHTFVRSTAPPHQVIGRDIMQTSMIFARR